MENIKSSVCDFRVFRRNVLKWQNFRLRRSTNGYSSPEAIFPILVLVYDDFQEENKRRRRNFLAYKCSFMMISKWKTNAAGENFRGSKCSSIVISKGETSAVDENFEDSFTQISNFENNKSPQQAFFC